MFDAPGMFTHRLLERLQAGEIIRFERGVGGPSHEFTMVNAWINWLPKDFQGLVAIKSLGNNQCELVYGKDHDEFVKNLTRK